MVTSNEKVWTDCVLGTRGLLEEQRQWRVKHNFVNMKLRTTQSVIEEAVATVKRFWTVP